MFRRSQEMKRGRLGTIVLVTALSAAACEDTNGDAGGGNGAGGSPGGGGGAAGSISSGGAGQGGEPPVCKEIAAKYGQAVASARQCDPLSDVNPCTVKVEWGLACGCTTFVSATQQTAISQMADVKTEWAAAGCGGALCGPCQEPTSGLCDADGGVGKCIDVH